MLVGVLVVPLRLAVPLSVPLLSPPLHDAGNVLCNLDHVPAHRLFEVLPSALPAASASVLAGHRRAEKKRGRGRGVKAERERTSLRLEPGKAEESEGRSREEDQHTNDVATHALRCCCCELRSTT